MVFIPGKKTFPKRLALSAAVTAALLSGYGSRQAFAGSCSGSGGTYTCSGTASDTGDDAPVSLTSAGDLTVTTSIGFGIDSSSREDNALALTVTGTGDVSFTDNNMSSITGYYNGIYAFNSGTGGISITATGTVTATETNGVGIYAYNSGTGDITIDTAAVAGGKYGIEAKHEGTGAISITATGAVTATEIGILAENDNIGSGGVTISTAAVTGLDYGIYTLSNGTGAISITATGTVTGSNESGIWVINDAIDNAEDITINTAAVTGDRYGVFAFNKGIGAISITSTGTVTSGSVFSAGIFATTLFNSVNDGGITINTAAVTSGGYGIHAKNYGTGATNITVNGAVTGGSGSGIYSRYAEFTSITLNSGASVSATSGKAIGNDAGDSTLTVNSGASITGSIDLGNGTDIIQFDGGDFSGVTLFDGGDGASDSLSFAGSSGTLNQALMAGIEVVTIGSGSTIAFTGNAFNASALTGSQLTVQNGGILNAGGGLTFTGNLINSGGVVSTQNDSTTVSGDYTQTAGGILRIGATSAADHGSLVVVGTATFEADAAIDVDVATVNTLIAGSELLDVISAGTLTASTFIVTDNSALLNFSAVIDGNTVDLLGATAQTVVEATALGGKPVALGAAAVFDTSPSGLTDVIDQLNLLETEQEVANALESTVPIVAQLTNIATNAVTGIVADRQDLTRGLSSGDGFMTDRNLWVKSFGGWTDQDDRQGVTGYDIDSYGLAAGVDGDLSSTWNVGFALAYINSDVESALELGSHTVDVDSYLAKIYATKMIDDVTALNLQIGAGVSDYDSKRRIFTGDVASADYDSWNVQFSAELERSYQVSDKTVVTPYVNADYGYVDVDGYNESGAGALNLNVDDDSSDSLIIGMGAKASHSVSDNFLLTVNADIGYDLMADRSSLTSSFAGGGAQFTTEGIKPDEWVYNAGVAAKYSLTNGTEISFSYNINARQDYTDQSVSANFRFMF